MCPANSLKIAIGVEVRVRKHDRIGRRKIDAQATRTRWKQEQFGLRLLLIEVIDDSLAVVHAGCAVQTLPTPPIVVELYLEDIEHHRKLREN